MYRNNLLRKFNIVLILFINFYLILYIFTKRERIPMWWCIILNYKITLIYNIWWLFYNNNFKQNKHSSKYQK